MQSIGVAIQGVIALGYALMDELLLVTPPLSSRADAVYRRGDPWGRCSGLRLDGSLRRFAPRDDKDEEPMTRSFQ